MRMVTEGAGRVAPWPAPPPAPLADDEALLRVELVGVCGSDAHVFEGSHPYLGYPQVQGHEVVGIVEALGARATGLTVGERVVLEPTMPCGECVACRRDRPNCCVRLGVHGITLPGGLTRALPVRAASLHPVPGVDPEIAVLVEPLAVALHAVDRAGVGPDDTVLVLGAGSIGRSAVVAARHRGARVIAAERTPARRPLLQMLGADLVVPAERAAVEDAIGSATGDDGCTVVIDTTGSGALLALALDVVAYSGAVVAVGISPDLLGIPVSLLTRKEVTLLGSRNSAGDFPEAIRIATANAEALRATIGVRVPFERAQEAFQIVLDGSVPGKVIVEVGG
jgi:threonine dehydrogenase-like Zn-dependent dehydrogenase